MNAVSVSKPSRFSLYLDLIRWNRPAGWLLLLWPSLAALWVAAGGFPGWHLLAVFVAGTILMRSAGCCVNDVADREFDQHVKRTAQRPVTSGRVGVKEALGVGSVLAFIAFVLVLTTNIATIAWSFIALLLALVYPYAKRHVSMPQAVLGVAFSFGIPMAFAAVQAGPALELLSSSTGLVLTPARLWQAVQGSVPPLAWWLLLGNLFWVLAYDTEYAMVDRDDDLKIGIKTSAITLGERDVAAVTAFYLAYLGVWTAALWSAVNPWVWGAMLAVALAQVAWHWLLIKNRTRDGCFKAFRLNHWLGFTVFAGVVLGLG
jgi:4-hydroxybenzoate polyprenyltransferase